MATRSIADILPVLIPRLDDTAKIQLLCSIAPVCQEWWTAVEDLYSSWPACSIDIEVKADNVAPATWQAIVSSFVHWLPRHAGVVRSICISKGEQNGSTECLMQYTYPQLQLAVGRALQAASSAQGGLSAAAGHHRLLQLQEYSSNCMGNSCILQALPAAHLTALQLALPQHSRTDPAMPSNQDLKAAIRRLTNLQSLSLTFKLQQTLSTACCEAFAALSQLTSLELGVCLSANGTSLLLQSLQAAPLQKLQLRCSYESWHGLDLVPLTHLIELQLLLVQPEVDAAVLLPLQLKVLAVKALMFDQYTGPCSFDINTGEYQYGPPVLRNFTDLQHLQAFSSTTCNYLPSSLFDHLAQLPSLQDLSLAYKDIWSAGLNHWEWSRMSQLHRLRIGCAFRESEPPWRVSCCEAMGELEHVLCSITDVTSLTCLQVGG